MLTSLIIPPIEDMTNRSQTPEYIKETISRIKKIIEYDQKVYDLLYENSLVPEKINRQTKNPIEIRYHGSYKRNTDAFYFRKIEKSDIDIYLKIGGYNSSPSIFKNRHNHDKNFDEFREQWASGVYDNFRLNNDSGGDSYVPIPNFANFKNNLANYLSNILNKSYEVENANKVIRIKSGSLTIELAICGEFNLTLQNNAKGHPFYKQIKQYYSDKSSGGESVLIDEQFGFKIFGINIVTSSHKEIQNFPKVNDIFVYTKNSITSGNFSKYSRYFKNLIKTINKEYPGIIKTSSYHLECVLYSVKEQHFSQINFENEKLLIKNLANQMALINENQFNDLKEINGLIILRKKLNYNDFKTTIDVINKCLEIHL